MDNPIVYLAAPFFNKQQKEVVSKLEHLLFSNYTVYSPSRDGIILTPDADDTLRQQVFNENVKGMDDSDIIVACLDDKDTGVLFELGYSFATHKPIISFSSVDKPINVMLDMTVVGHAHSYDELKYYMSLIHDHLGVHANVEKFAEVAAIIKNESRKKKSLVY